MCLSLFSITKFIDVSVEKLINRFSISGGRFKMLFKLTKIVYRAKSTAMTDYEFHSQKKNM